MVERSKSTARKMMRIAGPLLALTALAACTTIGSVPNEGIGFREARFVEISAMREWRKCKDDALMLDTQARRNDAPARYLASARLLQRCESQLGPEVSGIAPDERMQSFALGIQNQFKGGDVAAARAGLEKFKAAYGDHDLYLADGSSFIETMELLFGLRDRTDVGEFSTVNVSEALKSELRRARYWKHN